MSASDRIARLFSTRILGETPRKSIDEESETAPALAMLIAAPLLENKHDEPQRIYETPDGFIVAGQQRAVLVTDDGMTRTKRLEVSPKPAQEALGDPQGHYRRGLRKGE